MHLCPVKRKLIWLFAMISCASSLAAQGIPVGTWRAHFPLKSSHSVALLEDYVLVGSSYGLFIYDPKDKVSSSATVVEGLSDVGMTCLEGDPTGQKALLGYSDGGLDVWTPNDVRRIGDIPQSGAYPGQSDIRSLAFASPVRAFAATGFGIVEINLTYGVIQGTYLLRSDGGTTPTYDLSIDGDSLFAATETGLWSASLQDPLYLPQSWVQSPFGRTSPWPIWPFRITNFWYTPRKMLKHGMERRGYGRRFPWTRPTVRQFGEFDAVHKAFYSCEAMG